MHLVIYCVLSITIRDFLVFEIRKNLDLRKIFVIPKIFLKSRFHCTVVVFGLGKNFLFESILGRCGTNLSSPLLEEVLIESTRKDFLHIF